MNFRVFAASCVVCLTPLVASGQSGLSGGPRLSGYADSLAGQAGDSRQETPSEGIQDLTGLWNVVERDGEPPVTVRFAPKAAGEGFDTYAMTFLFGDGPVEFEATFDGEALTTRLPPGPPAQGFHRGAIGALQGMQISTDPNEAEESEDEGRYVLEESLTGRPFLTFEASSGVERDGTTPVQTFRRLLDPDVVCPAEWEASAEILWAAPRGGKSAWGPKSSSILDVLAGAVRATGVDHRIFVLSNTDRDLLSMDLIEEVSDISTVIFVVRPGRDYGTVWIRDFGPLTCRKISDGSTVVGDAMYFQPPDDPIPTEYAKVKGWPVRDVALRMEGGNFMSDGQGRVLVTNQLMERNARDAVEAELFKVGAREILFFERLPHLSDRSGDGTGHIDMLAKLTSTTSAVVGSSTDPDFSSILDRNAAKFEELGYTVTRLPMGNAPALAFSDGAKLQTYTNTLFVGRTALVPQYGDVATDAAALAAYSKLGYQAVPIDASGLIAANGAVHCVSMQVPAN